MLFASKRHRALRPLDYPFSKHYSIDFPARLDERIEPHMRKDSAIEDFINKEAVEKEIINITLLTNKHTAQNSQLKPE